MCQIGNCNIVDMDQIIEPWLWMTVFTTSSPRHSLTLRKTGPVKHSC